MAKSETYFEQVPVEEVKRLAVPDSADESVPEADNEETDEAHEGQQARSASSTDWRELASAIINEQNPRVVSALAAKLDAALGGESCLSHSERAQFRHPASK